MGLLVHLYSHPFPSGNNTLRQRIRIESLLIDVPNLFLSNIFSMQTCSCRSKKLSITGWLPFLALTISSDQGCLVVMCGCRHLNPLHHFFPCIGQSMFDSFLQMSTARAWHILQKFEIKLNSTTCISLFIVMTCIAIMLHNCLSVKIHVV